jgi:tRNA (guanine-N7-)-methyltransferase
LELHPELVVLDPALHRGQWGKLLGNEGSIFLEIGAGKGQFLCGASEQMPDTNLLGLEKYDSVIFRALQRISAAQCHNVLLLRGEAENLLKYFDVNEIERIYLNFSDPWPKKNNIKKRLTHTWFLDIYRHIMVPNGEIHLKTDNRNFFEFTLQHMNEYGMRFSCINLDLHVEEPRCNIRTEYETAHSARGETIYRLVCSFM